MLRLTKLSATAFDVPLLSPFGIATGSQHIAHNVLVKLGTEGGVIGYGEGAPVEHISGETQAGVFAALQDLAPQLIGCDLTQYRRVSAQLAEALSAVPSAIQAVEIALFDVLSKKSGMSLLSWFGGAEDFLTTDMTVTTGTTAQSADSARRYASQGFEVLKVKIGGASVDRDLERLRGIAEAAPKASLILDGNTAFTSTEAIALMRELGPLKGRIALFEQPVEAGDFEGLKEVEAKTRVLVAADESLRSDEDFRRIIKTGGISAINIKTAKLGLVKAWDLLTSGKKAGLQIMIGGMVETELSMTTSACLAAGVGGVQFVDLDTPPLLAPHPLRGGYVQQGPRLDLSSIQLGHGVVPTEE